MLSRDTPVPDPQAITADAALDRAEWLRRYVLPHEHALRSWLRRRRLDRGFEQDVVHDAYCLLLSHDALPSIRNMRSYLFTVAHRLVLQRLRRDRVVQFEMLSAIEHFEPADDAPGPEQTLSGRQQLELVKMLIDELPERCRAVLSLRKISGFSQRETAARLGISENIVEKEVARGLALILKRMEDEGFERRPTSRRRRSSDD